MRNKQPIVARLIRGPRAGQSVRVRPKQAELHYRDEKRTHVYRVEWPKTKDGERFDFETAGEERALVVRAVYAGTRRR